LKPVITSPNIDLTRRISAVNNGGSIEAMASAYVDAKYVRTFPP
jgi:hypothetical protein